jgi:hypothetical protein
MSGKNVTGKKKCREWSITMVRKYIPPALQLSRRSGLENFFPNTVRTIAAIALTFELVCYRSS